MLARGFVEGETAQPNNGLQRTAVSRRLARTAPDHAIAGAYQRLHALRGWSYGETDFTHPSRG